MSDVAPRLATHEDLLSLPEDVRAEVLAGEVVTSPSPTAAISPFEAVELEVGRLFLPKPTP